MQQHLRWQFAGRGGLDHLFDDLVLCVSELVTAAVEVNAPTINLSLERSADAIRLALLDRSPGAAAAARIQRDAHDHRARIIEAVATRWGVDTVADGEQIWVEFDLEAAASRRPNG